MPDAPVNQQTQGDPGSGGTPAPPGLEAFWDSQANALKTADLVGLVKEHGELKTFRGEHDARLAALPKTADEYKLDLDASVKLPDGITLDALRADPLAADFRKVAHDLKLAPDQVNRLFGVYVNGQLARLQQDLEAGNTEAQAEKQKLGENADQRIGAVESYLKSNLSADQYQALRVITVSAAAVEAVEALIKKANAGEIPVVPGAIANGRDTSEAARLARLYPSMSKQGA